MKSLEFPELLILKLNCLEDFMYFRENMVANCFILKPQFSQHYKILEELGKGSQATVYLCKDIASDLSTFDRRYAVKTYIVNTPKKRQALMREVQVMRDLKNCRNITQLRKIYVEDKYQAYHLIMDYAPHGNLLALLKK